MSEFGTIVFEGMEWKNYSSPHDPTMFTNETMIACEVEVDKLLKVVHPTLDSEEKRKVIIDFIHEFIKTHFDCEVCPYGSVPLKTFLPDGDIDMTILMCPSTRKTFEDDVVALLREEEKHCTHGYELKNIKVIDAEVKVIKCRVQDIAVDISFNQLGGLSTLCFLEQIDRFVGRNHLFKRSIMLVKAWCYFESRILGAHNGLLSTYAVEILVLYILQMFHSSISGPLETLYRFLEYYSQFDWENYCISLKGPVRISALSNLEFKTPEREWSDRMLSDEFLESCIDVFSVQPRELEEKSKAFQKKFLNIIDPLKESNNLGRSVPRGNFYRIRSALKYGACSLGKILLGPKEKVVAGLHEFFSVTILGHGQESTLRIENLTVGFEDEEPFEESSFLDEGLSEDDALLELSDEDYGNDDFGNKRKYTGYIPYQRCTSDPESTSSNEDASEPLANLADFARNSWDVVHESLPLYASEFVQPNVAWASMDHQLYSMGQTMYSMNRNLYSLVGSTMAPLAFQPERYQTRRGIGTYFPYQNKYYGETSSHCNNEYHTYGTTDSQQATSEFVFARGGSRKRAVPSVQHRSTHLRDRNLIDVESVGALDIQFGSLSNLSREVQSESTKGSGLDAYTLLDGGSMDKERDATSMLQLKNEKVFSSLS